ncbi:MAG: cyclic pyranopterin monophosphate synthase MoaC [Planctomycetales bacterium]|nr:cyclic pyranopterin monophosphate synthase MoaC [Planctomycetales bacterium]
MSEFSHFTPDGKSRMVDVGDKPTTVRMARASGRVTMQPSTLQLIQSGSAAKGDVLGVARLAGIMAAKKTDGLIPLCHSLPLSSCEIDFEFVEPNALRIEATVKTIAQTGVEMEALTAVSIAALTVYDMCKAVDRAMEVHSIQLEEKLGGKSGHFLRGS